MKKRHVSLLLASLFLILLLVGCGDAGTNDTSASTESFNEVMTAERIDVQDAYDLLKDCDFDDPEADALVQQLKELIQCSGGFVQVSEDTGDRYSAEVSFYLASGNIKCSIDYSGYMGEISDGDVIETQETGYRFESSPEGDLFGRKQDFKIYFGNEQLHITWADICDYVLTRGDGSVESVQDYKTPFDETEAFKTIVDLMDTSFPNTPHEVVYDKNGSALNLYFQAPDKSRAGLVSQNNEIMDAWQGVSDSMCNLSDQILTVTKVGGNAYYVNIYWVDKLKKGEYTQEDQLLWIQNGVEKYNAAKASNGRTGQAVTNQTQKPSATNSVPSNTYSATNGERNALQKAHAYLDYTPFSYSGLIEQLEYEGYSYAEAKYAADNCGADWYEEAAKKAQKYLDYTSFSRSGLVEQLEYEGFTHDQAEYGVRMTY